MRAVFDLNAVGIATKAAISSGCYVLQAHRFAKNDALHLLKLLKWADLPLGAQIVDLGSGTGAMAYSWKSVRPDLDFCLVNVSQAQLDSLPQFCEQICCDMCDVPKPDNCFDAAVCCFAIGHVDAEKAFAEMRRLVRPGGIIFVYDMARYEGTNEKIHELAYAVEARKVMEETAKGAGLILDFYMEPQEVGSFGKEFIGPAYEDYFAGVKPAIWRWINGEKVNA
jgi:ubiquinone/menaquinone biosynthesis C-methylase UbiE